MYKVLRDITVHDGEGKRILQKGDIVELPSKLVNHQRSARFFLKVEEPSKPPRISQNEVDIAELKTKVAAIIAKLELA